VIGGEDEDALELAQGSEVHDQEALVRRLARESAIDDMLAAYLRDEERTDLGPRAHLVLYVVAGSPSCAAARRNLERTLFRYEARDVLLVVRDLAQGPRSHDEHAIQAVPALMMRRPHVASLPADLGDGGRLLDELLRSVGVRRRAPR